MPPAPRKALTLKDKVELIRSQNGVSLSTRKLAEMWKIGRTQVSHILKNKNELLRLYHSGANEQTVRVYKGGPGEMIDKAVLEWYSRVRSKNAPVSRTSLQRKAREIATHLQIDYFRASDGWFDRFKKRHNIEFKSGCGETESSDFGVAVADWFTKITEIIEGYDAKNIFNADETGLFYRALPDNTRSFKGEACREGEIAKERLTVLLCASMCGEKLRPLVVGKALTPKAFKNVDASNLGVDWKADRKAWMTSVLMTEWLEHLDQEMGRQHRKILLFLDNATCHARMKFDNIRLVFFPPNIAPTSQPLDQGIIQNFKIKYRRLALQHLIAILANNSVSVQTVAKEINELKAVTWIERAWNDVTPAVIANCFKKAGFPGFSEIEYKDHSADNQALNELLKICPGLIDEDYVRIDDNLSTESTSEDVADILAAVTPQNEEAVQPECDQEDVSENPIVETGSKPLENHTEALVELIRLQQFYMNNQDQKGFKMVSNLIMHHERQLSLSVMEHAVKVEVEDVKIEPLDE